MTWMLAAKIIWFGLVPPVFLWAAWEVVTLILQKKQKRGVLYLNVSKLDGSSTELFVHWVWLQNTIKAHQLSDTTACADGTIVLQGRMKMLEAFLADWKRMYPYDDSWVLSEVSR